ncbi:hypothetical protein JKP88DRAFT_153133, partial [Tribonema minus]
VAMSSRNDAQAAVSVSRAWQPRNCINLLIGDARRKQIMPLVVHLLPQDLAWWNASSDKLWEELQRLLKDQVITPYLATPSAVTGDEEEEKSTDAISTSRRKARRGEKCVQGEGLQFTFRFRPTKPVYSIITFNSVPAATQQQQTASKQAAPAYASLPLNEATLLAWVFKFDPANPYAPLPTETVEVF